MIQPRPCRRLVLLLALAALPACARRAEPERVPEPAVVVAVNPEPEPADTISPPRPIPPAAEPADARNADVEVFAIASGNGTWMFQHPNGEREVNGLHIPVGRSVKFTLTAEEDERQLEVPALPLAIDAFTGRYNSGAVLPKRTGEFGIWSGGKRVGTVFVVEAATYERFLKGEIPGFGKEPADGSPAFEGRQLFLKLQCVKCHTGKQDARAPDLEGLFGTKVPLEGGGVEIADEAYIKESILKPRAKVVEGWKPIMPSYEGQVTEEELAKLVAYIKTLKRGQTPKAEQFPSPVGAPTVRPAAEVAPPPRAKPGG
jgi:cytochrome c oxidase subunit II